MRSLSIFFLCALAVPLASAEGFYPPSALAAGVAPRGLAVGDLNSDGYADAVAADFGSGSLIGQACSPTSGALTVVYGSHRGPLGSAPLTVAADAPRGLALGDVDGDGKPEVLATLYCGGRLAVYPSQAKSLGQPSYLATGAQPVGVAYIATKQSAWVAVANYGSGDLSLFKASKEGLVAVAALALTAGAHPTDVEFLSAEPLVLIGADIANNSLSRFELKADGSVLSRQELPLAGQPCKLVAGDLNGDGKADLSVARFTDNGVSVYLGKGKGLLEAQPLDLALNGQHPNGLSLGRQGGHAVLAVAERDSDQVELLRWTPQGLSVTARIALGAQGVATAYGPVETAFGDLNGDGQEDLFITQMHSGKLLILPAR